MSTESGQAQFAYAYAYAYANAYAGQLKRSLGLERAGFVDVHLRYEEMNMALWCGTNPFAVGTSD